MAFAAVWFALRESARAESAMEMEYERSEQLLANILPASIAARLKDPAHDTIADRYDDASILFADIAGFTERASETAPCDLVAFLDRLYTEFDVLVERHRLEKVKTTGDAYMVVSGVPEPRPDHVQALAAWHWTWPTRFRDMRDPQGRHTAPDRPGMRTRGRRGGRLPPVLLRRMGRRGERRIRMETTDSRAESRFRRTFTTACATSSSSTERGDVDVKGKGVMHTWYLVGRRDDDAVRSAVEQQPERAPLG